MVEDPVTYLERQTVAETCVTKLELKMFPTIIDLIDNKVSEAYGAHPDRLYLIGKDGKIAFAGGRGPSGFLPDLLEGAIEFELAKIASQKRKARK